MIFIVIGCLAFIFLYIFDMNKIFFIHRLINFSFAIGVILIAVATIGIFLGGFEKFHLSRPLQLVFWLFSICSLLLLFYSLFIALPFRQTYMEGEQRNTIVEKGVYALCRHPGVIWFFFFYLFLWLATGIKFMMWAGIIWTVMDILHVYIQDRWLFPKNLQGYEFYKQKVPFLIPNLKSTKQCFITL